MLRCCFTYYKTGGFIIDRTMYWADWGNHPKIETAAMDGTLRQTLVHENLQWPTGESSIYQEGPKISLTGLHYH